MSRGSDDRLRVVRVIARLNVGGPARHVLAATEGLSARCRTTLVTGNVQEGETEATAWIREHRADPVRIPDLGRSLAPFADLRAMREIRRILHAEQPHVLHTHTSKAGFLGRLAARGAPVGFVVHTFHGHVFDGYFGATASRILVGVERRLARITDAIVAVSDEVAEDLIERHRIAPREKVRVIPVGIPLDRFIDASQRRGALRKELGLASDVPLVAWVGRLAEIKDVALALDVHARVRAKVPGAVLVIAGDGPQRDLVVRAAADPAAGVRFLGLRDDIAAVWADADVALLTSRNEGTPVALIEAAAARVPAVATRVGGVPSVVCDGTTGLLAPSGDAEALAGAVAALLDDAPRRQALGRAARDHVKPRFGVARMLRDLEDLYASLKPART